MISELFPPVLNAEGIVAAKFAKALVDRRVELHVVAGDFSGSAEAFEDRSEAFRFGLGKISRFASYALDPPLPRFRAVSWWKAYYAKVRLRSEVANYWAYDAFRHCVDLIAEQPFDLVVCRLWTVNSLVVEQRLSKYTDSPLAVVMNDPYPESLLPFDRRRNFLYRVFRDPLRRRLVKQALQRSAFVVFPNERLCSHMEQSLDLHLGSKCLILPHIGWSSNASASPPVDGSPFEILHCGVLSPGRASDVLLKSLQNVVRRNPGLGASIRLTLLGHPIARETLRKIGAMKLEEIVRREGPVSYEASLVRMKGASALLLAENMMSEGIFLPSKFVDYLCSGRPLLMFSPEKGAVSDIVHGYDHPGFLGQTEAIATERLMNFMLAQQRGDDLSRYCSSDAKGFSPSAIADKFLDTATKMAGVLSDK